MKQRQAERRKYHFIYKTICKINGKYYFGMHSTDNLADGYIGSGTLLWHSIKKHGQENFSIEIMEHFPDRASLKKREAEIITKEMLNDSQCMNLTLGGDGGWEHQNSNSATQRQKCLAGNEKQRQLRSSDEDWKMREFKRRSNLVKEQFATGKRKYTLPSWEGKFHSTETKSKIGAINSLKQSGSKNSNFGKVWIYSDLEKKSISVIKEKLDPMLESGWKKGRKIKF